MFLLFWNLFWGLVPTLIYLDATNHRIGRVKNYKFSMAAGFWGFFAMCLSIVSLPLYLINRRHLIARAKDNPIDVTTTHKLIIALILLMSTIGVQLMSAKGMADIRAAISMAKGQ